MNRNELFKEAIKENEKRISRICYHFFGPGENAKDAYQEILLKIWQNIESFRGESQIKTWINRIAVNVCINFFWAVKKKTSVFIPYSHLVNEENLTQEETFKDEENKLLFFRCFMDNLSTPDKALVSLYLEDFNTKEISEITGLSEGNVRVRIYRIKTQIRKEWESKYGTR